MLENLKADVRAEAEKGARKAIMLPVTFAIVLALVALDRTKRKRRRR